jgi:hypothetical protein
VNGAYTQNAGSLKAAGGLATGTLSGTGGTIDLAGTSYTLNQTANGTYAGSLTGGGVVNKFGTGTLTLAGGVDSFAASNLNIYAGGVTVATADLLDHALGVLVDGAGTLTLGANQTIHALTGTGTLNMGSSTLTLADGGNFSGKINGTGQIAVASGDFTLNSAITSTGGTFSIGQNSHVTVGATGSITAANLTVTGSRLDLVGTATVTNTTLSNGAVLHLGNGVDIDEAGALTGTLNSGTTTVAGGSFLTGNGTVTGNIVVGGTTAGTVAPGNSPGVITFDNLSLGDNATAAMQVDGAAGAGVAGGNDLIRVNGKLALSGNSTLAISKSVANSFELGLGQGIQLFQFTPGNVSGHFGSVTLSDYTQGAIFNLATGTLIGLGTYTPTSFAQAVSTTRNQAAIMSALRVSDAGGVPQYYGGRLMSYVTSALARDPASVSDAFARWSPEAYAGITDQMKVAVLDSLPELGGYDTLTPGRTIPTGSFTRTGISGSNSDGYAQNKFRDSSFNFGVAHQFSFAQAQLSYGRSNGNFYGDTLSAKQHGNQVNFGISAPIALGQALRVTGRLLYGDFKTHGTRSTNSGQARFDGVKSDVFGYGGGLEYLKQAGPVRVDTTAEFIGLHEKLHGFSEAGSADTLDQMTIDGMTHNAYIGRVSGTLGYNVSPMIQLYANGTFDHEFGSRLTDITARVSLEDTDFTVANTGLSQNRFSAGGGVKVNLSQRLQLNAGASAGTSGMYHFGGGVRFVF